ncbi:MAG: T9SS type A sorting domain-containing protein [Chitinophagaceae bacterium]
MKPLLLLCFALLISIAPCKAQTWAPIGMTWTYDYLGDIWDHTHSDPPVVWEAADTMTMLDHLCTIIKPKGMPTDISTIDRYSSLLTYEESGIVYLYNPMAERFETLYDFNKKVGETWSIAGLPMGSMSGYPYFPPDTLNCAITVVVDSIKTLNINGHILKAMFVSDAEGSMYGGFAGTIIEGIGHTVRPYPRNTCISSSAYRCSMMSDCYYHYDGLRCIDNGTIGFYDFKIVPGCDWIRTDIKEQKSSETYTLLPNPAQDHITMHIGSFSATVGYQLQVSNLVGQTVHSSSLHSGETQISIADWAPGLYFYTVYEDNRLTGTGKLIVQ